MIDVNTLIGVCSSLLSSGEFKMGDAATTVQIVSFEDTTHLSCSTLTDEAIPIFLSETFIVQS
jgi:hypothetical protein